MSENASGKQVKRSETEGRAHSKDPTARKKIRTAEEPSATGEPRVITINAEYWMGEYGEAEDDRKRRMVVRTMASYYQCTPWEMNERIKAYIFDNVNWDIEDADIVKYRAVLKEASKTEWEIDEEKEAIGEEEKSIEEEEKTIVKEEQDDFEDERKADERKANPIETTRQRSRTPDTRLSTRSPILTSASTENQKLAREKFEFYKKVAEEKLEIQKEREKQNKNKIDWQKEQNENKL